MGEFDKILKENIEALFLPLSEKLFGIRITQTREVKEKLQSTIEREPDFLKWVTDETGQEFLLHLEFQTQDDPKMVYRMAEYKALLLRKFEVPVQQFVLYLGAGRSRMTSQLPQGQEITGYTLKNLSEVPLKQTLSSSVPEEILLAILGDYPPEEGKQVIQRIIERLWALQDDETTRQRYLQHLVILSRLRKLDNLAKEITESMPITYDIESDSFYKEGLEKGIERGIEKGAENTKLIMIENMLKNGVLTIAQIAEIAETTEEAVQKIAEGL
ncbi:MAG TPA: hypothetical protein DCE41_36450 [Cytophagales bacterium]|nr:hypothetical protein [Cytophagales bacterium]HAA17291.1 hypothetical protein [Cytophagales bacterium]